ncbi:MAG TPA: MFS transporter [Stellaceae bacterium]|jgi:MFS family permease|nr:MFS transporter [Stellaceae bacterium]
MSIVDPPIDSPPPVPGDTVAGTGGKYLTGQDIRTLVLAALGGALEFYDFVIFVFFTAVLSRLFFPPNMAEWLVQVQTFGIFAAGYLARPLGGIIMAHFGDVAGRKRMFTLSVFLMALPTFAIGLIPTYATVGFLAPILLLVLRILQGAAIGGEVPGAWVFVAEHVPRHRVGFAVASLTSGLTAGILLGSLVAAGMNAFYSHETIMAYAWRLPFMIGGVFGLIAVHLRRWLEETPIFEAMRRERRLAEALPLGLVLRRHSAAVLISMLSTWVLTAGVVVVILMAPTLLQTRYHLAPLTVLIASCFANVGLCLGCLVAGAAVDVIGVGITLAIGCIAMGGATWLLFDVAASAPAWLLPAYSFAGFCVGVVGAIPSVLVHRFPAAVRFSGISFSYNIAYAIFGGLTPVVVTLFMKQGVGDMPSLYVGALSIVGTLIGLGLMRRTSARAG